MVFAPQLSSMMINDDDLSDFKLPDLLLGRQSTADLDNMDSLIHHANWYDRQCISHYDDNPAYLGLMVDLANTAAAPATSLAASAMGEPMHHLQHSSLGPSPVAVNAVTSPVIARGLQQQGPMAVNGVHHRGQMTDSKANRSMEAISPACHTNDRFRSSVDSMRPAQFSPAHSISSNDSDDLHDALEALALSLSAGDNGSLIDALSAFLHTRSGIDLVAKAYDVSSSELSAFLGRSRLHHSFGGQSPKHHNGEPRSSESHSENSSPRRSDSSPVRSRKSRGSYSRSKCLEVVRFVQQGGHSARAAAKKFGIPKSTVHNWLHEDIGSRPERGHRKRAKPDSSPCSSPRPSDPSHTENETAYNLPTRNSTDLTHVISQPSTKPQGVPTLTNAYKTKQDNPGDINMDANFDELKEDWVEQDNWYTEQYFQHYSSSPLEQLTPVSLAGFDPTQYARGQVPPLPVVDNCHSEYKLPKNETSHLPAEVESQLAEEVQRLTICEPPPSQDVIYGKISEYTSPFFTPTSEWCRTFLLRHGLVYTTPSSRSSV